LRVNPPHCILEANLGSEALANLIVEKLRKRNIPIVAINLSLRDIPYVNLDMRKPGELLIVCKQKRKSRPAKRPLFVP